MEKQRGAIAPGTTTNSKMHQPNRSLLHYQLRMLMNNGLAVPRTNDIRCTRSGDQTVLKNTYDKRQTKCIGGNRRCKVITTYEINRRVRMREKRAQETNILKSARREATQTGNQILFVSLSSDGVMNVFHHGNIPGITEALLQTLQKSELPEEQQKADAWMYPMSASKIYINNCLVRRPEPLEVVRRTVDPAIIQARAQNCWSQEPFNSRAEGIVGYRQYDLYPMMLTGECSAHWKNSTIHAIQRFEAGKQATLTPAQMQVRELLIKNYYALHPTLDPSKSGGGGKKHHTKQDVKIKTESGA